MTLVLKGLPQIDQTGQYVWLTDKTGEYAVTDNEGGWGDPNPELNQSALLAFVYRRTNPKTLLEVVGSSVKHSPSYTNDIEVQFQWTYSNDGFHEFQMARLMVSSDDAQSIDTAPVTFVEGSIWYNSVDGLVKQMVGGVPVSLDLTDTDDLDAIVANSSVTALLCEINYYKNLVVERNNKYADMREARRLENTEQVNRLRQDMMDISLGVITADYQFKYGLKLEAQDTIESLLDQFGLATYG